MHSATIARVLHSCNTRLTSLQRQLDDRKKSNVVNRLVATMVVLVSLHRLSRAVLDKEPWQPFNCNLEECSMPDFIGRPRQVCISLK